MAKNISINPTTLKINSKRNVVKVQVSPKDYFDLGRMQDIQKDILGELGCLACCSGWDIRFDMQREFLAR